MGTDPRTALSRLRAAADDGRLDDLCRRHGIRVLTIAPGIVETPMLATVSEEFREGLAKGVPFPQRLARPDEYAQLALSLVDHDYLNGEVIRMDGALRMAPR